MPQTAPHEATTQPAVETQPAKETGVEKEFEKSTNIENNHEQKFSPENEIKITSETSAREKERLESIHKFGFKEYWNKKRGEKTWVLIGDNGKTRQIIFSDGFINYYNKEGVFDRGRMPILAEKQQMIKDGFEIKLAPEEILKIREQELKELKRDTERKMDKK